MNLYSRDYTRLTADEKAEWESLKQREIVSQSGRFTMVRRLFRLYPKAVRHFIHLFPNNYLDVSELNDEARLKELVEQFQRLLDSTEVSERVILEFVRDQQAYFIIASILNGYFTFGHHEAYLFREFPLGTSHKVDYLLVGKGSDGWQFVFVELESPAENITLAAGDLGQCFRKGVNQVADWVNWLEAHYGTLVETFDKCRPSDNFLPTEFRQLDKSRLHFVVVAGRRVDFKEKTYRIRRKLQSEGAVLILHYDNIVDAAKQIIGRETY